MPLSSGSYLTELIIFVQSTLLTTTLFKRRLFVSAYCVLNNRFVSRSNTVSKTFSLK